MRTDDFDFNLPEELIAQTPILNRSESKLLVLDRKTGNITHEHFYNIINHLDSNDILVLNNTKVIPARIYGVKEKTGAKIELLILKNIEGDFYQCLVKPARRIHVGDIVSFNDGLLRAECTETFDEGIVNFKFLYEGVLLEILDKIGSMPLPPYIREKLEDKDRYQTVYAKNNGSAAAPTAGLHFTPELLEKLKEKGVTICYVTLHIGLGTFRPVSVEDVTKHVMHTEEYFVSSETADILNKGIKEGKRIVAVGTTSTRTLESAFDTDTNSFKECHDNTNIFIYPGYKFKVVNAQITNFHLPKSTLVMLVSAFASKEIIINAYEEAIKEKYRFFSFGDSMFIK
jgi:S-adenosylmethionine:tRNA ribosyltransferase-isomerase